MSSQQTMTELYSTFQKLSKRYDMEPRVCRDSSSLKVEKKGKYFLTINHYRSHVLGGSVLHVIRGEYMDAWIHFPDFKNEQERAVIAWPYTNPGTKISIDMRIDVGGRAVKTVRDHQRVVNKAMKLVEV